MDEKPYLSIVAASRNDDHGGNILKRMRLFVNGLLVQSNRHGFPVELIIVEWNPLADKSRLREVLPKPDKGDQLTLRYIEVPGDIHNIYKRASEIPLFQMIAKNVGIRRANGTFILCTNIDLLFSDSLFQTFAQKAFRKDTFYRANRCDVPDGIDPNWALEKQLDWCRNNIIRRLGRDTRFRNINLEQYGLHNKAWIKKWIFDKINIVHKAFLPDEKRAYYELDTFACGDFTLMAKDAWMKIQGYLELDLYSIHIDSLALMAASALGYKQHVFSRDRCTYHIDHSLGWESTSPLEKIKLLEKRPGIDYHTLLEAGLYVLKNKTAFNHNRENWGFSHHSFIEYVFNGNT